MKADISKNNKARGNTSKNPTQERSDTNEVMRAGMFSKIVETG